MCCYWIWCCCCRNHPPPRGSTSRSGKKSDPNRDQERGSPTSSTSDSPDLKDRSSSHQNRRRDDCLIGALVVAGVLTFAVLVLATTTGQWLVTEERLELSRIVNGTARRADEPEVFRLTYSGLWTVCVALSTNLAYECTNIDYFPREEYSPDPSDSTLAIPYAVTKSALFFLLAAILLVVAELCLFLGIFIKPRPNLYVFGAGIVFIVSGLVMLVGIVMYISIFKSEVGSKLRPRSSFQGPAFIYKYGYSFLLYVSGFVAIEFTGTTAIFLHMTWQQNHHLIHGHKTRILDDDEDNEDGIDDVGAEICNHKHSAHHPPIFENYHLEHQQQLLHKLHHQHQHQLQQQQLQLQHQHQHQHFQKPEPIYHRHPLDSMSSMMSSTGSCLGILPQVHHQVHPADQYQRCNILTNSNLRLGSTDGHDGDEDEDDDDDVFLPTTNSTGELLQCHQQNYHQYSRCGRTGTIDSVSTITDVLVQDDMMLCCGGAEAGVGGTMGVFDLGIDGLPPLPESVVMRSGPAGWRSNSLRRSTPV